MVTVVCFGVRVGLVGAVGVVEELLFEDDADELAAGADAGFGEELL